MAKNEMKRKQQNSYILEFSYELGIPRAKSTTELEGLSSVLSDYYTVERVNELNSDLQKALNNGESCGVGFDSSYLEFDGEARVRLLAEYSISPVCEISIQTFQQYFSKWSSWVSKDAECRESTHIVDAALVTNLSRSVIK